MARAVFYYRPDHPLANHNGMVDSRDLDEYEAPRALDAPIMVDRFYEGAKVPGTGEDIGSRTKHREYMRRNGLTTVDDYTHEWAKAAQVREEMSKGNFPDKRERREEIARINYEVEKSARKRRS